MAGSTPGGMREGIYERWVAGAGAEKEGEAGLDGSPSSIILERRGGGEEERGRGSKRREGASLFEGAGEK